jgi:hypothetical protein
VPGVGGARADQRWAPLIRCRLRKGRPGKLVGARRAGAARIRLAAGLSLHPCFCGRAKTESGRVLRAIPAASRLPNGARPRPFRPSSKMDRCPSLDGRDAILKRASWTRGPRSVRISGASRGQIRGPRRRGDPPDCSVAQAGCGGADVPAGHY